MVPHVLGIVNLFRIHDFDARSVASATACMSMLTDPLDPSTSCFHHLLLSLQRVHQRSTFNASDLPQSYEQSSRELRPPRDLARRRPRLAIDRFVLVLAEYTNR